MCEHISWNVPKGHMLEQYIRPKISVMTSHAMQMVRENDIAAGSHCMVCNPCRWAHIHAEGTLNSNVSDINITDDMMIRAVLSVDFLISLMV